MIKTALIDHTGKVSDDDLVNAAAALNAQAVNFAKPPTENGWGLQVSIRAVTTGKTGDLAPDEWPIPLMSEPDQPDALGYHDVGPNGCPYAPIFPFLDPSKKWETIAGHENWEMVIDFLCNQILTSAVGKLLAAEVCDPVEEDSYDVEVIGTDGKKVSVPVTNYVTPWWFGPAIMPAAGVKFDAMGKLKSPISTTPGGYWQWLDPRRGWQQVVDNRRGKSKYRRLLEEMNLGRTHRRKHNEDVTKRIVLPDAGGQASALVVCEGLELVNGILAMLSDVTRGKIAPKDARERLREYVTSIEAGKVEE